MSGEVDSERVERWGIWREQGPRHRRSLPLRFNDRVFHSLQSLCGCFLREGNSSRGLMERLQSEEIVTVSQRCDVWMCDLWGWEPAMISGDEMCVFYLTSQSLKCQRMVRLTSWDCSFCLKLSPRPKDIQFSVKLKEQNPQIFGPMKTWQCLLNECLEQPLNLLLFLVNWLINSSNYKSAFSRLTYEGCRAGLCLCWALMNNCFPLWNVRGADTVNLTKGREKKEGGGGKKNPLPVSGLSFSLFLWDLELISVRPLVTEQEG